MPTPTDGKTKSAGQKWTETYGNTLCTMAGSLGMPVEELALLVAGIMGNLSGPGAGLVGASGRRISPGFSILAIGHPDHRFRRAADHLLGPALSIQDLLRTWALRSHRGYADLYCFGVTDVKALGELPRGSLHDRCVNMLQASVDDLKDGDAIADHWDAAPSGLFHEPGCESITNGRLPGPRHRPSFVFTTSDASRLEEMLTETMDQCVYLVDQSGGFFRGSFVKNPKQGNRALAEFAQHLGGTDIVVPRLHASQGYGRFHRSRVGFLAALPFKELAEMTEGLDGAPQQVLSHSILWKPTWRKPMCFGPDWGDRAWKAYKAAVLTVVNSRIERHGPVLSLRKEEGAALERVEHALLCEMDGQPEAIRRSLGSFGNLVPQLAWAFLLLRQSAADTWWLKAAEATARHALGRHVSLLNEAANCAQRERAAHHAEKIADVLQEKGPCGTRELQRSIFRLKQTEVRAALEVLQRANRVILDESTQRYRLGASRPVVLAMQETESKTPAA